MDVINGITVSDSATAKRGIPGGLGLLGGLVAYWKMDEATGDALDINGNNLTSYTYNILNEVPALGSAAGKINTARDFEADTQQNLRRLSGDDLSTGNDFTFSLWVNAESLTTYRGIIGKSGANQEFSLYYYPGGGYFNWSIWSGVYSVPLNNFTTITVGNWYHIVCWSTSTQIGIAINDGTPATYDHPYGLAQAAPLETFAIGSYGISSFYWDGQIDEVGFWKRALTTEERAALYNNGNGLAYPFTAGVAPVSITKSDLVTVTERVRVQNHQITVSDGITVSTASVFYPLPVVTDLRDGLVAYWSMDEVLGTDPIQDVHGTSHLSIVGPYPPSVGSSPISPILGDQSRSRNFQEQSWAERISGDALATGDIDFTFSVWLLNTQSVERSFLDHIRQSRPHRHRYYFTLR